MGSETNATADARARAEAKFHLAERRKTEAEQVMSEVNAAKMAEMAKTARLRALRLAKEEEERAAAATARAAKPVPGSRRKRVTA